MCLPAHCLLVEVTEPEVACQGVKRGSVTSFSGLTAVFVRAMMADLLSMPDDVMAHIAEQALWRHEGIRAWCRLASTCSRLWRLKLPHSMNHSWRVLAAVPLEGEYQYPEAALSSIVQDIQACKP